MRYSLFIGRWQPFHAGHQALVETALKEGKNVLIAVRDTPRDEKNPYSFEQVQARILEILAAWEPGRVKVILIPDITEVCYGRDVGYDVRKISLSPALEEISGTKIRASGTL